MLRLLDVFLKQSVSPFAFGKSKHVPGQFALHVQEDAPPALRLQLPDPRCAVSAAAHKPATQRINNTTDKCSTLWLRVSTLYIMWRHIKVQNMH